MSRCHVPVTCLTASSPRHVPVTSPLLADDGGVYLVPVIFRACCGHVPGAPRSRPACLPAATSPHVPRPRAPARPLPRPHAPRAAHPLSRRTSPARRGAVNSRHPRPRHVLATSLPRPRYVPVMSPSLAVPFPSRPLSFGPARRQGTEVLWFLDGPGGAPVLDAEWQRVTRMRRDSD